MLRGLNTAMSGMIAQQRRQDALAHNLANMNTPGYKNDHTVMRAFPEMLINRIRDGKESPLPPVEELPQFPGGSPLIGYLNTGVYNQEMIPDFASGDLLETGNPLDFAIADEGIAPEVINGQTVKPAIFFAVQTPNGETQYTRNGKFTIDGAGRLVTSDGALVLNAQGNPIETDENAEVNLNQLGLVRLNNPHQLVRSGSNTYRWTGDAPPPMLAGGQWNGFSVQKGFVEGANVDAGQTITDMMVTMRSYESNQKVIQAYDRTMEQLNSVGRLG